jgi:hypothetical protein
MKPTYNQMYLAMQAKEYVKYIIKKRKKINSSNLYMLEL